MCSCSAAQVFDLTVGEYLLENWDWKRNRSAAKDHVALTRSTGIYRIIYQQLMENRSAERWLEVLHTPCALVPRLRVNRTMEGSCCDQLADNRVWVQEIVKYCSGKPSGNSILEL
ncbi:hypothetical protein OWV82_002731 [Melia azedarach]|uniref:Uncharacterized protein n=2 Tax=Melia azedarach TaxID=155640 RepID=A0ACC1Z3G7_MELAZ|nr:hypothetical protein OWV82_002731 [Melia azedarach]KAJ4730049.1 hypothetical protein OWV82_002731 [Melia azedarach]